MSQASVLVFHKPELTLDKLIVKAAVVPPSDLHLVDEIKRVMHAELLLQPLEGQDKWLLELLAHQAYQIVQGRMARPYTSVETVVRRGFFGGHHEAERVLCTDGCFHDLGDSGVVVARYATLIAAESAGQLALNRRDGGLVSVTHSPYLK